ncbi:MAG: iron-sulfur cluster assembly scaffold protein [Patescibacteria group bacterium]|nr:iron-sulfur cluster assembly scaffold protein [Patescibacteria group bacterium]
MSIYQEIILDHYRNPRNQTPVENPTGTVTVDNPLCGDKITMSIREKDGVIEAISFTASGCAISIASASILSEYALGKSKETLRKLDKTSMIEMIGVELSMNRVKCALLPLEALSKIILSSHV